MKLRFLHSLLLSLVVSPACSLKGDIVEEFKRETIQGKVLSKGNMMRRFHMPSVRLHLAEKIYRTHTSGTERISDRLATCTRRRGCTGRPSHLISEPSNCWTTRPMLTRPCWRSL